MNSGKFGGDELYVSDREIRAEARKKFWNAYNKRLLTGKSNDYFVHNLRHIGCPLHGKCLACRHHPINKSSKKQKGFNKKNIKNGTFIDEDYY